MLIKQNKYNIVFFLCIIIIIFIITSSIYVKTNKKNNNNIEGFENTPIWINANTGAPVTMQNIDTAAIINTNGTIATSASP